MRRPSAPLPVLHCRLEERYGPAARRGQGGRALQFLQEVAGLPAEEFAGCCSGFVREMEVTLR